MLPPLRRGCFHGHGRGRLFRSLPAVRLYWEQETRRCLRTGFTSGAPPAHGSLQPRIKAGESSLNDLFFIPKGRLNIISLFSFTTTRAQSESCMPEDPNWESVYKSGNINTGSPIIHLPNWPCWWPPVFCLKMPASSTPAAGAETTPSSWLNADSK